MRIFYLFPILFFFSFSSSMVAQAQEVIQESAAGNRVTNSANHYGSKIQNLLLPNPIMKNTGNPEKDIADYEAAKEKWINNLLTVFANLPVDQRNKIKEVLQKENPEDIVQGKILAELNAF